MIRRCSVEDYKKLVDGARKQNPNFHISSDIIVGFPGETDKEFIETVETIEQIGFGDLHLFRYSPREGTAALRLPNHVPKEVAKERMTHLRQIAKAAKRNFLHSLLDQKAKILWERTAETIDDNILLWKGYTQNYVRVHTQTNRSHPLFNQITTGTLSSLEEDSILVTELTNGDQLEL